MPGDYLHKSRIQTSGIAFAASLFTLSTRPSLQTSCCFSRWASTDPMSLSCLPPVQSPWTWDGLGCRSTAADTDPLHPHSLGLSLLHTSSTSKPTSVRADDVEQPRNATNITRPPGIQVLVINSSPELDFAPLTRFFIQNSSRLCHLPAFCRHSTLPCSLGAIQQSRTVWREKHHCEAS